MLVRLWERPELPLLWRDGPPRAIPRHTTRDQTPTDGTWPQVGLARVPIWRWSLVWPWATVGASRSGLPRKRAAAGNYGRPHRAISPIRYLGPGAIPGLVPESRVTPAVLHPFAASRNLQYSLDFWAAVFCFTRQHPQVVQDLCFTAPVRMAA